MAKKKLVPIACFGGAAEELLRNMPQPVPSIIANTLCELEPTKDSDWLKTLTTAIEKLFNAYPRILIIHGRSNDRYKVKAIVDNAKTIFPYLPESIILERQVPRGKTIPELFEDYATRVDAAIAVATPDDLGTTAVNGQGELIKAIELAAFIPRARENVWVEAGWFWGRLGRDKFLILRKGNKVEIPSDLSAIIRYTYDTDPSECSKEILEFISRLRKGLGSNE
jgi:predicted nucleotide-binding protein